MTHNTSTLDSRSILSGEFIERIKNTPEYEAHKNNVFTYSEEEPEEDIELD